MNAVGATGAPSATRIAAMPDAARVPVAGGSAGSELCRDPPERLVAARGVHQSQRTGDVRDRPMAERGEVVDDAAHRARVVLADRGRADQVRHLDVAAEHHRVEAEFLQARGSGHPRSGRRGWRRPRAAPRPSAVDLELVARAVDRLEQQRERPRRQHSLDAPTTSMKNGSRASWSGARAITRPMDVLVDDPSARAAACGFQPSSFATSRMRWRVTAETPGCPLSASWPQPWTPRPARRHRGW